MYFDSRKGVWDIALMKEQAVCVHLRLALVDVTMYQTWFHANMYIFFASSLIQGDYVCHTMLHHTHYRVKYSITFILSHLLYLLCETKSCTTLEHCFLTLEDASSESTHDMFHDCSFTCPAKKPSRIYVNCCDYSCLG